MPVDPESTAGHRPAEILQVQGQQMTIQGEAPHFKQLADFDLHPVQLVALLLGTNRGGGGTQQHLAEDGAIGNLQTLSRCQALSGWLHPVQP